MPKSFSAFAVSPLVFSVVALRVFASLTVIFVVLVLGVVFVSILVFVAVAVSVVVVLFFFFALVVLVFVVFLGGVLKERAFILELVRGVKGVHVPFAIPLVRGLFGVLLGELSSVGVGGGDSVLAVGVGSGDGVLAVGVVCGGRDGVGGVAGGLLIGQVLRNSSQEKSLLGLNRTS